MFNLRKQLGSNIALPLILAYVIFPSDGVADLNSAPLLESQGKDQIVRTNLNQLISVSPENFR
ncbi:MAG: hypothetical protein H6623_00235 [Bdellovibrionaceae bacterium]|nr:hypothetical protein [Pseudobdellovibrionaceae bacterium]